jgi:hypothetical protein
MSYRVWVYPYPQRGGCSILVLDKKPLDQQLFSLIWDTGFTPKDLCCLTWTYDSKEAAAAVGVVADDFEELFGND